MCCVSPVLSELTLLYVLTADEACLAQCWCVSMQQTATAVWSATPVSCGLAALTTAAVCVGTLQPISTNLVCTAILGLPPFGCAPLQQGPGVAAVPGFETVNDTRLTWV